MWVEKRIGDGVWNNVGRLGGVRLFVYSSILKPVLRRRGQCVRGGKA